MKTFLHLLFLCAMCSPAPAATRPNALFILCDDLRPDALGCYGSKHVKTPNIDALAKGGRAFRQRLLHHVALFTEPREHSHRDHEGARRSVTPKKAK